MRNEERDPPRAEFLWTRLQGTIQWNDIESHPSMFSHMWLMSRLHWEPQFPPQFLVLIFTWWGTTRGSDRHWLSVWVEMQFYRVEANINPGEVIINNDQLFRCKVCTLDVFPVSRIADPVLTVKQKRHALSTALSISDNLNHDEAGLSASYRIGAKWTFSWLPRVRDTE